MERALPARRPQADGAASLSVFLSLGFRPFFLGAGVYAVAVMGLWLLWLWSGYPRLAASPAGPIAWHAHEMVFGFGVAAVAGFLLTAVPNWTGALPLSGAPLAALFAVWIAGRLAMTVPGLPAGLAQAADLAFVPLLALLAVRQIFVKPAPRNALFLLLLVALVACNAVFHLSGHALEAMHAALMILVLLVALVGGRIVPAFTHNWLHLNAPGRALPERLAWIDGAAVGSIGLLALAGTLSAPPALTAAVALAAALANGGRLVLWRGLHTWRAPIIAVMHVAYAWLVVGLVLAAAAALVPAVPRAAAVHAFGTGAVGTMILAVMSRSALGHTGRPLVASAPVVAAYALVSLAALLRTFGVFAPPDLYTHVLMAAGLAWMAAFTLFVAVYAPMLVRPRTRGRAGKGGAA